MLSTLTINCQKTTDILYFPDNLTPDTDNDEPGNGIEQNADERQARAELRLRNTSKLESHKCLLNGESDELTTSAHTDASWYVNPGIGNQVVLATDKSSSDPINGLPPGIRGYN